MLKPKGVPSQDVSGRRRHLKQLQRVTCHGHLTGDMSPESKSMISDRNLRTTFQNLRKCGMRKLIEVTHVTLGGEVGSPQYGGSP
jgi:hypothetical protein